jgi:hypothetical protein
LPGHGQLLSRWVEVHPQRPKTAGLAARRAQPSRHGLKPCAAHKDPAISAQNQVIKRHPIYAVQFLLMKVEPPVRGVKLCSPERYQFKATSDNLLNFKYIFNKKLF